MSGNRHGGNGQSVVLEIGSRPRIRSVAVCQALRRGTDIQAVDRHGSLRAVVHVDGEVGDGKSELVGHVAAHRVGAGREVTAHASDAVVGPTERRRPAIGVLRDTRTVEVRVGLEFGERVVGRESRVEQVGEPVDEIGAEDRVIQRLAQHQCAVRVVGPCRFGGRRGKSQGVVPRHDRHVFIVTGNVGQIHTQGKIVVLDDVAPLAVVAGVGVVGGHRTP